MFSYSLRVFAIAVVVLIASTAYAATPQAKLSDVIDSDDAEAVRLLIEKKPKLLEFVWNQDRRPLHLAARDGRIKVIEELVRLGADRDPVSNLGFSPIHLTIIHRKFSAFELLTKLGANPALPLPSGEQPIHLAAQFGCIECVEALVDAGVSLDVRQRFGKTPLHLATEKNHRETVLRLLDQGADPNLADKNGNTPLHNAARFDAPAMMATLLKMGSDASLKNTLGFTPLLVSVALGHSGNFSVLQEYSFDIHAAANGDTAILMAAKIGKPDTLTRLIELGANVDDIDSAGFSAIYYSASLGHRESSIILINEGSNVSNAPELDQPLQAACRGNYREIAEALTRAGALPIEKRQLREDLFASGVSNLLMGHHLTDVGNAESTQHFKEAERLLLEAQEQFQSASDSYLKKYKSDVFWTAFAESAGTAVRNELIYQSQASRRRQIGEVMALSQAQTIGEYHSLNDSYQEALDDGRYRSVLPGSINYKDADKPSGREELKAASSVYKEKARLTAKYLLEVQKALGRGE